VRRANETEVWKGWERNTGVHRRKKEGDGGVKGIKERKKED
jgi:hypothetical protein